MEAMLKETKKMREEAQKSGRLMNDMVDGAEDFLKPGAKGKKAPDPFGSSNPFGGGMEDDILGDAFMKNAKAGDINNLLNKLKDEIKYL